MISSLGQTLGWAIMVWGFLVLFDVIPPFNFG